MLRTLTATLTICLALVFCLGNKGCADGGSTTGGVTTQQRVISLALSIPGVIRTLLPNTNQTILGLIDDGFSAYRSFKDNPTASNWERAKDVWDTTVKGHLLNLHNSFVSRIVGALDILNGQVFMPPSIGNAPADPDAPVKTKFKSKDVQELEDAINAAQSAQP